VKEFWVYTLMRLGLFVGAFCIVFGVWFLIADEVDVLWAVVIAFVISGVASYVLLERQRSAFAQKVEARAKPIEQKFDAMRTKEDDEA
jgi:branched-subunit amino acid permease